MFDQDPMFAPRTETELELERDDRPLTPQRLDARLSPPMTPVRSAAVGRYASSARTPTAPVAEPPALGPSSPCSCPELGVAQTPRWASTDCGAAPKAPKRLLRHDSDSLRPVRGPTGEGRLTASLFRGGAALPLAPSGRSLLPPPDTGLDPGFVLHSKNLHASARPRPSPPSRYAEQFAELEHLGDGAFGTVFKVRSRLDGQVYAVKKICTRQPMVVRLREVDALQACRDHPHVMRFHQSWVEGNTLFLLLEYHEAGPVAKQYPTGSEHWTEPALRRLLLHVARALAAVHGAGRAHLDVKPENVYSRVGPAGVEYVLGDFGLACPIADAGRADDGDLEGDSRYLDLVLLNSTQHLPAADVFSLGASAYELARGLPLPVRGEEWHRIRDGELPGLEQHSPEFRALLAAMMAPDPAARPTAHEVAERCIESGP